MNDIFELLFGQYQIFLLVLVRTSGIFLISPLFSAQNIPNILKVGLSFSLSLIISSALPTIPDLNNELLLIILFKELLVGFIIGMIAYVFFTAFYVMGQIMDMNIGFGMVNVMDPQNKVQVPLMGNFYYMLAFILLLSFNGHHLIVEALMDSYSAIPIGTFKFTEETMILLTKTLSTTFEIGFKLSTPIVAVIFLTDAVLGIMAKTIPQMNVFVIGMPLKVLVGMFIVMISMPIFYSSLESIYEITKTFIYTFINI